MHLLFENADEVFRRFVADLIGDVGDGEVRILKQYLCLFQTHLLKNLRKGFSGGGFDQPGSILRRIMEFFGDLRQSHGIEIILNILKQSKALNIRLSCKGRDFNAFFIVADQKPEDEHQRIGDHLVPVQGFVDGFPIHVQNAAFDLKIASRMKDNIIVSVLIRDHQQESGNDAEICQYSRGEYRRRTGDCGRYLYENGRKRQSADYFLNPFPKQN